SAVGRIALCAGDVAWYRHSLHLSGDCDLASEQGIRGRHLDGEETMSLDENLFSILRGKWPEAGKTFLETGAGRQIAYGELDGETARLANAIVACGVKPGDRVAVQTEKSPEALLLYLACLRAGAAYLPLNTAYTPAEVEYFVGDAEPALVVCRPGTRET